MNARPLTPLNDPNPAAPPSPRGLRYYEKLGQSCDWVVRCHDCKRLITAETIHTRGQCPACANTRVEEVRTLSFWEYLRIRVGLLRFPHWREFLKEMELGS